MIKVRVVVQEIEGLAVSVAADHDGVIWVVLNPRQPDPYTAIAEVMREVIGCLPDVCTYEVASPMRNLELAS